jgi:hypothetical protein
MKKVVIGIIFTLIIVTLVILALRYDWLSSIVPDTSIKPTSTISSESGIIKKPSRVDIEVQDYFIYEGIVYLNAADIDWVKETELTEGELLGEIQPLDITNSYADWEATMLPVGTKIYECKANTTILLAATEDGVIPYLKMVEG